MKLILDKVDFQVEKEIINSKVVIDHFGYWPTFHDSEIISIKLERTLDKDKSLIQIRVYSFEMTSNLKGKYFELLKHCLIDIEFVGINSNEMDGFNHQNVVLGLNFGKEGEYLFCQIDSAYGIDGYIEAKEIKIIKLDPISKEWK